MEISLSKYNEIVDMLHNIESTQEEILLKLKSKKLDEDDYNYVRSACDGILSDTGLIVHMLEVKQ